VRAISPELIPYVRGYGTARDYLEALVIERSAAGNQLSALRQTKAQWGEGDLGPTDVDGSIGARFIAFPDGSLRLKGTIATVFTQTTQDSNQIDLNRVSPLEMGIMEWVGPEPNDFEIQRVTMYLNPRVSASQKNEMMNGGRWRLELLAAIDPDFAGFYGGRYVPLAEPLDVLVTGDSAGPVNFDFGNRSVRPQPKLIQPLDLGSFPPTRPPRTAFALYALTATGEAASNAAVRLNSAQTEVTQSGNTLRRRRFVVLPSGLQDQGVALSVPYLVIETGTYTEQTITFSAGNLFDLGAAPTGDVELVGIVQKPAGTDVTLEIRNDADTGWVEFENGRFEEAGTSEEPGLGLTSTQTRKMRATMTPNIAGNLTPTLRKFGRQAIRRIDFSRVATIEGYEQAFSPETHMVEIPRPRLVAVKDGPKSGPAAFTSKIERLLAENFINDIRIRWHVGDAHLSRDKWTHMDDFLVLDSRPRRPVIELQLVGLCALLKDLAPPFSPGTNYAPDGTQSIGSYTDLVGGTTNIHLAIDELEADETDGIRSGTSPSNQEYIFTFPTLSDIAGRRLFLDVDYAKDQSAGEQIDAKFRVYNGGTLVMESSLQVAIGPDRVQKTFELSKTQIEQLTDLLNLRGACVANAPTPGTGRRLHLYWARFRSGGKREVVIYPSAAVPTPTLKAVYDDLLANRLAIPANLRGSGVENITDTVSKQLTGLRKRSPGAKDVVAKTEVEAIAFIDDRAIGSGEGRIKAFDLSPGQAIRAVFRSRRITLGEASPGHERRLPEYFGGYRWDATAEEFKDEVRAVHDLSLLKIGTLRLGPPKWWDEEIGKWIDNDALAERLAKRVVDRLGTGEMLWSFDSSDRYPELEMGDIVAVETDLFISRDPNLDIEIKGRRWAVGPLQRVGKGRYFTIHPRGFSDILSSAQLASRIGAVTILEGHGAWRGDRLFALWVGDPKVRSVKVATSTTSQPAAGTGTVGEGQTGELDTGPFTYTPLVFITITPYSGAGATGVQGTPFYTTHRLPFIHGLVDSTTGKLNRGQDYVDGKFALKASDVVGKETDDDLFISTTKTLKVGTVASPGSITKTLRVPFGEMIPVGNTATWAMVQGYLRTNTANQSTEYIVSVVMPKGVTLTTFRVRTYRQTTSDVATCTLSTGDDNGNLTLLKTLTHATTGWATLSDSLTQLVGNEIYRILVALNGVASALDARYAWFEFDYTMPDYAKGI